MLDVDLLSIPTLDLDWESVAKLGRGLMSTAEKRYVIQTDEENEEYVASLSAAQFEQYEIAMNDRSSDSADYDPHMIPTVGCAWEAERGYPDPVAAHFEELTSSIFFDIILDIGDLGSDPPIEADSAWWN